MTPVEITGLRRAALNMALRLAAWSGRSPRQPQRPLPTASAIRRILVVELWNIGDVILTMPFLARLREIFPDAKITMLANAHAKTLLQGTGLVDDFIETSLTWRDTHLRFRPFAYGWRELLLVIRHIRARKFDVAFQAKLHFREHIILAASGARRRVGFGLGRGRSVALTDELQPVPGRHRTDDWLALLSAFDEPGVTPAVELSLSAEEKAWADNYLQEKGIAPGGRLIGIHPGASVDSKRWSLSNFERVAETLATNPDYRTIVFVEPGGYGESIAKSVGVPAAQVGLRQLIALIGRCALLVCNDSGPMHIAGALGVRTVALFESGIEQTFSPLGSGHRLLTPPKSGNAIAQRNSIDAIPVTAVLEAIEAALGPSLASARLEG